MARLDLVIAQKDGKTGLLSEIPYRILTQKDFIHEHHPTLELQNFPYLFEKDKLDYFEFGSKRYVVMTEKTRAYTPNDSSRRRGNS